MYLAPHFHLYIFRFLLVDRNYHCSSCHCPAIGIFCYMYKSKKNIHCCLRNSYQSNNPRSETQANINNEPNQPTLSQSNNIHVLSTTNVSFSHMASHEPPAYIQMESRATNRPFQGNHFPSEPPPAYGKV